MKITAKEFWTEILPECMIKSNQIPKEYYYLITQNKTLQKYIDKEVIKEFLNTSMDILIMEILYNKGILQGKELYLTSSYDINELLNIIEQFYVVEFLDDQNVKITRK